MTFAFIGSLTQKPSGFVTFENDFASLSPSFSFTKQTIQIKVKDCLHKALFMH